MELINQPFNGQLGKRLIELLESSEYHTLDIVVAFAKNSGVLRIKDSLEKFRKRGGKVNVHVGVDLCGTSYEALTAFLLLTDSLTVIHAEKDQTFHSKIYRFSGDSAAFLIVGSHNLTGGGLWTNFESSVLMPMDKSNAHDTQMLEALDKYISDLTSLGNSCMSIAAQGDIDKLLQNGYVLKEVTEQVRRAKAAAQDRHGERLFGNGAPAELPRVAMPKNKKKAASEALAESASMPPGGEGTTIWFETKRMTGGSRNILDLSKKSLIERGDPKGTIFDRGDPKFMSGTVEFFGMTPAATDQPKDITINFDGIDYTGNTILFPEGERANGTWRLQIKGVSSANQKITDAFKAKGEGPYLVKKIITFTEIQVDYYSMSVFPETELENFKAASFILARNGETKNAKQFGIIFRSDLAIPGVSLFESR